jgi:ubiquinone/menaquinone biosynthesis C-methylase UbiE
LATARELAAEHRADITFIEGNTEATGLPDASFDFEISEYGASIWCPPDEWLPEGWRLLRPGG